MRSFLYLLLVFLCSFTLAAQAPGGFNFQALARDASDNPIATQGVGVRVSIRQGGAAGAVTYSERHEVTTSDLGVFDLQVGQGTTLSGDFPAIDWGADTYFLQIDLDPAGGTAYTDMGATQLLSVPYALYAATTGDADADEQSLSLSGTDLSIENGNTVDLSVLQDGVNDADADPTNELQDLRLSGTTLSIDGGNTVDLSALQDGVNDADADPGNELQTLSLRGTTLSIDGGNTVDLSVLQDGVNDADADPSNELQTLSLSGTTLSLTGGGDVDLAPLAGNELWEEGAASGEIYYSGGAVGISVTNPQDGVGLHVADNLFIQSNLGALLIGYPNNGNGWRVATQDAGANLLFRSKADGGNSYDSRFNFIQDGRLVVNGTDEQGRLTLYQDGQQVGNGLVFDDGTANEVWHITHGFGLRFHYGNTLRGFINANTGAYVQSSDRQLKRGITGLDRVTDRLMQLRPSSYWYRDDQQAARSIGFVAQEVQPLFPELVHYLEQDDTYGINYGGFGVIAIKALQEQQEVIESQARRIEALEVRLARLEAAISN